ncbi:MAG: DEAD/DEAH box helicase [Thiohalocapsa sp.]|nr:DEAD/DEAH box helicase [Thiohalocapsa sp.]
MPDTFDDFLLPEALLRGVAKAGFRTPTPVQRLVIPPAMEGADLLVSAVTGSGKTAAFLLPIMQRLLDSPSPRSATRALVLVPTRELAHQVQADFMRLGSYTRLGAGVIIGGEPRSHQIATLRRNPELLVATPGRLLEHIETGEAELGDLECLVLDEADRMLDMGFADEVLAIIGTCRPERQSMLFSATLQQRGLEAISDLLLNEPRTLIADPVREQHPDITHQLLLSDEPEHKRRQLSWLLQHEPFDKALVFVNTRERAAALGPALQAEGVRCAVLHGEMDQRERKRVMDLFRRGDVRVLIATDVAARGLDIAGMQLVINADVPRNGDEYLHRTGRTGRAGAPGTAVTLVSAPEYGRMDSIRHYLRLDLQARRIAGMEARFRGEPKRGKPSKKAKTAGKHTEKAQAKPKQRLRDRKNIGKRRQPSTGSDAGAGQGVDAGFEPPKRKG